MLAVRKNRYVVLPRDVEKAYKKHVKKEGETFSFYE
jgi:26S proteasome regulatory subunit T3